MEVLIFQQQPPGAAGHVSEVVGLVRLKADGVPLQKMEVLALRRQADGAGNHGGVADAAGEGGGGRILRADVQVQEAAHHVAFIIVGEAGPQDGPAAVQVPGPGVLDPGQDGTVLGNLRLLRRIRLRPVGHDTLAGYGFKEIVLHVRAHPPRVLSDWDNLLYSTCFVEICQGALGGEENGCLGGRFGTKLQKLQL